jgi:hypothetical protein
MDDKIQKLLIKLKLTNFKNSLNDYHYAYHLHTENMFKYRPILY